MRHCLRKFVWVRLLSPSQALLRGHGVLPEEEELPGEEECFRSNPLRETLAEGLSYELLFAKAKKGSRHINIGEVRAILRRSLAFGGPAPDFSSALIPRWLLEHL